MQNNKRILVAVDDSSISRRIVDYVCDILGGRDDFHVGLYHLAPTPRMLEWGGAEDPKIEHRKETQRERTFTHVETQVKQEEAGLLLELKTSLEQCGVDVVALPVEFEERLDRKRIARDILKIAEEEDYGTIVVGQHSFSDWKHFFNRHVSEELLRKGKGIAVWVVE